MSLLETIYPDRSVRPLAAGQAAAAQSLPVALPLDSALTIVTPLAVTAGQAYAAGQVIGSLMTLPNAVRAAGSGGWLLCTIVNCMSVQTSPLDIIYFKAAPAASAIADRAAFTLAAVDFDKAVAVVHIGDWTALGTPSMGQELGQAARSLVPSSGSTLYALAIARGPFSFAAAGGVSVQHQLTQD